MKDAWEVLIVEDLPTDAELCEREIRKVQPASRFTRVETREEFVRELEERRPDLIISDFKLPHFDGMSALRIALELVPDTPFIIVTGSMDEYTAVDCMKAGAWDYVIKENIRRLGPAVTNAMNNQRMRLERKKAKDQLRTLSKAIEQSPALVMVMNPEGVVEYVNPKFSEITGYGQPELLGQRPALFQPDELSKLEKESIREAIRAGRDWNGEIFDRKKDGTVFCAKVSLSPIKEGGGSITHYLAIIEDVTAQKSMEKYFRQSQKMEAIGRLAGGVAHDFNNLLTVILGHVDVALCQVDNAPLLHADLEEIRKAAQRSADLARQLLAFARKQSVIPKVLDLNDTVTNMLKMLRRLIGEDIDLIWKPCEGIWKVRMDPSQVDQILANLVVNARDAIPGTGTITIETMNSRIEEAYCETHAGFLPGEFVQLVLTDSGTGMNNEVLNHIFEPFFTTKDIRRGTGLGLATVYGIVKQNEGFVNVYSEIGQGSSFKIFLPRFQGASAEPEPEEETAREMPTGFGEKILLVEDDIAILRIGKRLLERLNYTVYTSSTPNEAIEWATVRPEEIDLLITDVVMPVMNGKELSIRLKALKPKLRCLFMSGYTAKVMANQGILEEGDGFIQKPFSLRDLAITVREALGKKGGAAGPGQPDRQE